MVSINIISAHMIRYEKMRETQWFLTPTTCYEYSFSTLCTMLILFDFDEISNEAKSPPKLSNSEEIIALALLVPEI